MSGSPGSMGAVSLESQTDFWALPTPEFLSRCGSEPNIYISNKFPRDAEAGT